MGIRDRVCAGDFYRECFHSGHELPQNVVQPVEVQAQNVGELIMILPLILHGRIGQPWRRDPIKLVLGSDNKGHELAPAVRTNVNSRSAELPRGVELIGLNLQ